MGCRSRLIRKSIRACAADISSTCLTEETNERSQKTSGQRKKNNSSIQFRQVNFPYRSFTIHTQHTDNTIAKAPFVIYRYCGGGGMSRGLIGWWVRESKHIILMNHQCTQNIIASSHSKYKVFISVHEVLPVMILRVQFGHLKNVWTWQLLRLCVCPVFKILCAYDQY